VGHLGVKFGHELLKLLAHQAAGSWTDSNIRASDIDLDALDSWCGGSPDFDRSRVASE
jgi:hypothetical protein